jgi:hypothetical protein
MIPDIINFIWIGSDKIPQKYIDNMASFRFHHPNWQIILWDDHTIREIIALPSSVLRILENPVIPVTFKTDLMRYIVVEERGGYYADLDVKCIKPLHGFSRIPFVCGWESDRTVGCAFFGSAPQLSICGICAYEVAQFLEVYDPTGDIPRLLDMMGPGMFTKQVQRARINPFPMEYFFPPRDYGIGPPEDDNVRKTQNTRVIHYFDGMRDEGWVQTYNKSRGV